MAVVLLLLSVVVCCFPSFLAKIFSKDADFIQGVVDAVVPLVCLMVTMNLTVAFEVRTPTTTIMKLIRNTKYVLFL